MDLKKWKAVSVLVIFLLSILLYNIYNWVPSFFTSILFPVNKSIWEYNKVIVLSFLIWSVTEKLTIRKKKDLNTCTSGLIAGLVCSFLVMVVYTPIYLYILDMKTNLIVLLVIYFISIVLSVLLNYRLLQRKYSPEKEKKVILFWLLWIVINAILTYYQPNLAIFYDYYNNIYGLK